MTLFLLLGFLGVIIILFKRNQLAILSLENHKLMFNLRSAKWFQNHWKSGIILFILNALLFFTTCFLIFLLTFVLIPFLHLFVMLFAVLGSFVLWFTFNKAWEGTKVNRLKMGIVGSSFYAILLIVIISLSKLQTINPTVESCMGFIGELFGSFVSIVAFFSCLLTTGFCFNRKLK